MSKEILSIKNLNINSVSNKKRNQILKNINFYLFKNEILGIVGESGSGKTTLARYLLGIIDKDNMETSVDEYFIDDIKIDPLFKNIKKLRGAFINMIMQNPVLSLNPTMTIQEHFKIVLSDVSGIKIKEKQDYLIEKLLKSVAMPNYKDVLKKYPMELSVGMNQRINIALSVVNKPKILILDEPTSSVDEENKEKILNIINSFVKNNKMSAILITHDILSAVKVCHRVLVMRKGSIVDNFYSSQINFNNKYTAELYNGALLKRKKVKFNKKNDILIEMNKIYKNFGNIKVLNNFSMFLKRGETLGIVGPSGSGKTTISKLILGIYKPAHGYINIKKTIKIEIIFQNANLSLNHNQKIFRLLNEENYINKKKEYSRSLIFNFLKDFNLQINILEKYITELSEGQKQIIAIIRSLLNKPDVIILDEPTSSLDSINQKKILDLLIKIKKKYNLTYILISHNQRVIDYMCDRCICL
ncbi:MAG TPA: ATP-binding cassette domain-containing protein [bacterium]|nr:ATP-binding cassette domain-containing protein [bacterium]